MADPGLKISISTRTHFNLYYLLADNRAINWQASSKDSYAYPKYIYNMILIMEVPNQELIARPLKIPTTGTRALENGSSGDVSVTPKSPPSPR